MWLNERTLELIQLAPDGEGTERDRGELDTIPPNSAEARAMYEAMREVARQLDAVPMAEPPHVRTTVMDKIRSRTSVGTGFSRSRPTQVGPHTFRRRTVVAVIYAVAAAIVIGVGVDRLLVERVRPQESAASMLAPDLNSWPLVTRTPDVTGRALGDRYAVQPRTGVVDWDHQKLELTERMGSSVVLQRRHGATGSAMIRLSIAGR